MIIVKGATDITTYVNLVDSAAGTPETGLTITNIDATYTRMRAAAVKNDLTALAAVDSAHADNKAIEVDATNAPGLYRIDWPDAAFATAADKVILTVTCAGCAPAHLIVELVNYDSQDGVRLGLTALPNAAAAASGGLHILGTNATAVTYSGGVTANITGNITGNLSGSVGSVTGAVGSVTGAVGSVTGAVGSLAAQAKADVNAEVLDVLNVDTFAEPAQGTPAATNTLVNKLSFLYKFLRNKVTVDGTTISVFNDDAATVDHKSTHSDDGSTYTRGEFTTGP